MQPWPDQSQNGLDSHEAWQGFSFVDQNGQMDSTQHWSPEPAFAQASHDGHDAAVADFHFDPTSHDAAVFLGDQSLAATQPAQADFHGGHDSMAFHQHQQFSSNAQDLLDPAFATNIQQDLFAPAQPQTPHQAKVSLAEAGSPMGQMGMGQNPSHTHPHPQSFPQHDFSYGQQTGQAYQAAPQPSHYDPRHLVGHQAPTRQARETPVSRHYEAGNTLHGGFPQRQAFPTDQSPSPRQPAQHQYAAPSNQPFASSSNSSQPANFAAGPHPHIAYSRFQESQSQSQPQQSQFQQSGFGPRHPVTYQGPGLNSNQQHVSQQKHIPPQTNQSHSQTSPSPQGTMSEFVDFDQAQLPSGEPSGESPAKKRKISNKPAPNIVVIDSPPVSVDLSDSSTKRMDEMDALEAPTSTTEEARLLAESARRNSIVNGKTTLSKALPHLAFDGRVQLPVPKSYDKLSPLVAVPSRSGKPAISGLGYALPCEIQGTFTSQYKPSMERAGLDERRVEAKPLLDSYDRSMKALGKRQPKYTEYPHAFKEQLKADEASKKKAKRELEEDRGKPVRAAVRPADPAAAAAWDVLGIVHVDESLTRTSSLIAGRVQQAGELLISLRSEAHRAKMALDEATKDKKPEAETSKLRLVAEQKREALYQALDAMVEHADDAVLDNLGGHQKLVLSLVNTLIASIKSSDFSSKLVKIVLELFTHLSMTKKIVETTNFDTVRKRLEDKGDDEVKNLVRQISSKIRKFLKSTEPETATGYKGTSATSRAKSAKVAPTEASTSVKRARDEGTDARVVKKIAVEPGSSLLSRKLAHSKTLLQPTARAVMSKPSIASSLLPGRLRPVAKPAPKAESPAAADSPGASADDKAKLEFKKAVVRTDGRTAVAKKETKTPSAVKTAGSSSSGTVSSISSLLESINSKRSEPATSVADGVKDSKEVDGPETPEQRAKRLRKEARRGLRVSWKPETELVQIKVFEKDVDEDQGRDVNMIRDAADDRSEGMMLKRRANETLDDDDDDGPSRSWQTPKYMDMSMLPEESRSKNYVTRGGRVTFTTEEQKRMAEREQRELMVIYTDPNDIPPTPKSPPLEATTLDGQAKAVPLSQEDGALNEIHMRWQDLEQMDPDQALLSAQKRLGSRTSLASKLDSILGRLNQPGSSVTNAAFALGQPPMIGTATSVTAVNNKIPFVLGPAVERDVLASVGCNAWRDTRTIQIDTAHVLQYPEQEVALSKHVVEKVANSLAGKPYPATAPHDWMMKDEEMVREWRLGHNRDMAARQRRMEEERSRAEAEANSLRAAGVPVPSAGHDWNALFAQQSQPSYAPYLALLQQMNGGAQQAQPQAAAPPPPSHAPPSNVGALSQIPDSQLQSILAAINQPGQAPQPSIGGFEPLFPAYSQASTGALQVALAGDREWDRGEGSNSKGESHRDVKDARRKKTLPPHKPLNKALIGTKPCTFWQQGKCARGDKCTFRHD